MWIGVFGRQKHGWAASRFLTFILLFVLSSVPCRAEFGSGDSTNLSQVNIGTNVVVNWLTAGNYTLAQKLADAGSTPVGAFASQNHTDLAALATGQGNQITYLNAISGGINTANTNLGTLHTDLEKLGNIKDGIITLHTDVDRSNGLLGSVASNISTVNDSINASLYLSNFYLENIANSNWRNHGELQNIKLADSTAASQAHTDANTISAVITSNSNLLGAQLYGIQNNQWEDYQQQKDLLGKIDAGMNVDGAGNRVGILATCKNFFADQLKAVTNTPKLVYWSAISGLQGFIYYTLKGVQNAFTWLGGILPEVNIEQNLPPSSAIMKFAAEFYPLESLQLYAQLLTAWVVWFLGSRVVLAVLKVV